ncbi:PREDICTED: putative small ubiquitin-related modifier 4 [Camelina sativa]|uniref:Small ubiquitin-related modifier 4 n=1 Tax=Camelina sativa TaxID=90675 RepID=A0ABM0U258_CAMSA|nr:PREDICTED: putative small ubiquitin-related modifier 4 [Camelina sativa]
MSEEGSQVGDNASTLQSKVRSETTRPRIAPYILSKVYEISKVKKEGEKPKVASESSTHVTLNVKGQDEEGVRVFKVRRNAKLLRLMEHYTEMRGVEWNTFGFLLDGSRIREYHTPDELELKDGDEIDAMQCCIN